MMQKHAFLIIAHDNFRVLEKLLLALSHPDVDLYLHIDAKVKMPVFESDIPRLHILNYRIDTRWGDISQIETEYLLMETALKDGGYAYYHIISGTHYPLMSIQSILDYFDTLDGQTVFYNFCTATPFQENLKLRTFNFFTRTLGYGSMRVRRFSQILNRIGHIVQDFLKVRRNKGVLFYKASNWASFSEEAVRYLIDSKDRAMKIFKHSFCGDEFFAPTLLMESHLKNRLFCYDHYLKLEMGNANPRVLTLEDFPDLLNSGYMFARKFNDAGIELVEMINKTCR